MVLDVVCFYGGIELMGGRGVAGTLSELLFACGDFVRPCGPVGALVGS
jgi:hypothetical protein